MRTVYKTLLLLLLFPLVAYSATPTISNVTGTVSDGEALTIIGTNMVQEITGDYTPSAGGFEGANYSSDGWVDCINGDCAYDSSTAILGSKSFRSDISGSGGINCPTDNSFGDSTYRTMSRYVRMYVRFKSGFETYWANTGYTKMIEYVSPTGVYLQPNPASGGPTSLLTQITTTNEENLPFPETLETDHWYVLEYYVGASGLQVWWDGESIGTNSGTIDFGAPYPQIGIINSCPVDGSYSMYIDGVMSDTSRVYPASTIEISGDDGSTWVYQEPTSLSDTSVGIIADLPALTANDYLLRVTSSTQETSASYTLGGDGKTCYKDADGDLYSDGTSESVETCSTDYYESGDLTATSGDCDDTSASINPGATDSTCDGVDQDCSGADACVSSEIYAGTSKVTGAGSAIIWAAP